MRSQNPSFFIPFLLLLFLLLWISPACGGGNLSIFESTPKQKEQTPPTQAVPSPPKTVPLPDVGQPNQPDQKYATPTDDDDDEEEDDWDEDSVYDNDKSC